MDGSTAKEASEGEERALLYRAAPVPVLEEAHGMESMVSRTANP